MSNVQDIFTLIPAPEIRILREEAPLNLGNLCYKAVEKLVKAVDCSCRTQGEHQTVLNCCRLLTRLLPYIFEDPDWKGFFWESLPGKENEQSMPLAHSLLNAICVSLKTFWNNTKIYRIKLCSSLISLTLPYF